jgi:unsaturated rhamnogalacturonyl hydrolase
MTYQAKSYLLLGRGALSLAALLSLCGAAACGSDAGQPASGGSNAVGPGTLTPLPGGASAGGGASSSGGAESGAGLSSAAGGAGGGNSSGGNPSGGSPSAGTGGATASAGQAGAGTCAYACVDQCMAPATQQTGSCPGSQVCCQAAAANPLAHLADDAKEVGLKLAERFGKQTLAYSSVANLPGDGYKNACEWYGALGVAKLTSNQDLLNTLVKKFDPLKTNFVSAMTGGEAHVDRYIYGMVPLEIYLQTSDESYLALGIDVASTQQTTNQTRGAIDDMFMMTGLQVQAYRAMKKSKGAGADADKFINFMAKTMVDYLKPPAQKDNGLFFHNEQQAKVHWGRGNGWFAAGMAEIMKDLPKSAAEYPTIEAGYKKMMDGLLKLQGKNGLWYQVLDMPDNASNWEETSGSAMFTFAMIAGVRSGVLDAATYVPAIDKAWAGIKTKINAQGDVSGICAGTWYKASAQEYMALTKLTGDGHGQAPVLWAAAELLR